MTSPGVFARIYAVVRQIPAGRVASYGQIARLVGLRAGARTVGWALHSLPRSCDVPWHRVLNARGEIRVREGHGPAVQRLLLEEEGVEFKANGQVDMRRFGWREESFCPTAGTEESDLQVDR